MAITDYRYDPFLDVINVQAITDEEHTIPTSSPYTIRLSEVPNKANPTTMTVKDSDGNIFTEVSAQPGQGQFWPDYSVSYGDDWNTGTLLFNAADAGKTVLVTYNGMGTLVDDRLADMVELEVTGSEQPDRRVSASYPNSYANLIADDSRDSDTDNEFGGSSTSTNYYNYNAYYVRTYTYTGLEAGTYTLREVLQKLINLTHSHSFNRVRYYYNCNSDCSCGGG